MSFGNPAVNDDPFTSLIAATKSQAVAVVLKSTPVDIGVAKVVRSYTSDDAAPVENVNFFAVDDICERMRQSNASMLPEVTQESMQSKWDACHRMFTDDWKL